MKNTGLLQIKHKLLQCFDVKMHVTGTQLCEVVDRIISDPRDDAAVGSFLGLLNTCTLGRKHIYDADDEAVINLTRYMAEGGFGLVYEGRYRERVVVVKRLIPKIVDEDEEANRNFVRESVVHVVLYLMQGAMCKCLNLDPQYSFILPVVRVIKLKIDGKYTCAILTEMLDSDIWNALQRISSQELVALLIQTCLSLLYLRAALGQFSHGDLSMANVMFKERGEPMILQIKLSTGEIFKMKSYDDVYIIDFGMSCIKITNCTNYITLPEVNVGDWGHCKMQGEDLKFLFNKTMTYYPEGMPRDLRKHVVGWLKDPQFDWSPLNVMTALAKTGILASYE